MGPILVGQAVNLISSGGTVQELQDMVVLMIALAISAFGTLFIAYRWLADIAQYALFKLRKELFDHAQELSLNVFDRQPIGELMSGVTNDIDAIAALFQGPLGSILLGIFLLLIIAVAMIILNPIMAFVALLVVPAIVALIWGMGRLANPLFKIMQQGLANLSGLLVLRPARVEVLQIDLASFLHNQFPYQLVLDHVIPSKILILCDFELSIDA